MLNHTLYRTDDTQQLQAGGLQNPQDELLNVMTIMYMVIQEVLSDPYRLPSVQSQLCRWISSSFIGLASMCD